MPLKRKRSERQASEDDVAKKQKATPDATPTRSTAPDTSNRATGSNFKVSNQPDAPVLFDHITDDMVQDWDADGGRSLVTTAAQADEMVLYEQLQELVESCLLERLSGEQAGRVIGDMIAERRRVDELDVASHFLDIISLLDDEHQKNLVLRGLIAATGIQPQIFRKELDIPLLQTLNLVRDTFEKMRTRKSTNILYKQANFNLLREESEGYAKLITDFFNTVQDACGKQRDFNPHIAEDAFQRIMALVGAFDLDVGRVLDITLDVSANLLVKAYPFLMKFYRASSWWPGSDLSDNFKCEDQGFGALPSWALPGSGRSSTGEEEDAKLAALKETRDTRFWKDASTRGMHAFFELGSRHIADFQLVLPTFQTEIPVEVDSRGKESNPEKRQYLNERRKFILETGALPPQGNYDAAQLLGLKLRFYASPARNRTDVLPDNLIKLAAFLIKIGFISLRDLYPHLHPADEDMPLVKKRLVQEKAARDARNRPGAGFNALALAAALTDDTMPVPRGVRLDKEKNGAATPAQDKKDDSMDELPAPDNQKIHLLKALLLIGALPEALHIIGRFPWLLEVETSLPPLLHRIANHMLSKIAGSNKPLPDVDGLKRPEDQLADTSTSDGNFAFTTRLIPRPMRWLHNDTYNIDDGVMYVHYYVDWDDNIPICQTLDDVFVLYNNFLGLLGVKLGQDAKLYGTLLRLAKNNLIHDDSKPNRTRWLDLMTRLLVPALSMSKHNPELAQAVFDLLSLWPTSVRYEIYAEWFTGRISRDPDIRSAFDRNKAEARDVLRRVSNDSGKKQSRALAKVALASPGIVVMEMINQLESYSNMIPSLVECTRFFSPLASDVLTWCLINSVSGQGRDRQQADGMLTSPWLQALSTFVATLFTKYSNLDPTPVLQYLASELRSGNATDLEMIEQILVEMAGVRSDIEFNDAQVVAMAGGEQLQGHIMRQLSDTRHLKEKSAKRLIKALNEPKLVGQILVSIAQERQMYAEHTSSNDMPLKVLGSNIDKITAIFAQYLEVLEANMKPEQFAAAVPDVSSLIKDFGIEPATALTICRAVIRHRMSESDAVKKEAQKEKEKIAKENHIKAESNGDINMKKETSLATTMAPAMLEGKAEAHAPEKTRDGVAAPMQSTPWHSVLDTIIQTLTEFSPDLASRVSIPFYVTFWTLMQQDIFVPTDGYKREIARLDAQIKELNANRNDLTAIVLKDRDKKRKSAQETRDKLAEEMKPHMNAYIKIRARISGGENLHWFPRIRAKSVEDEHAQKDARHIGLLQECFLPRTMLSAVDAHFSWTLLKLMHDNGTPGFSLMHLLTHLFRKQELASLMFQCTAMEAQNFGRFLNEVLKHLLKWHANKEIYMKEALGFKKKLPGFAKNFDESGEPKQTLDWEEFRRMLFNFHTFLFGALSACFESNEYMHIRNAIVVLRSVCTVFPILTFQGRNMIEIVKSFSEEDGRQDLKLAAMSLLGPLKSGEKNWQAVPKFRQNDPAKEGVKAGSRSASTRPETPQPDGDLMKHDFADFESKPSLTERTNAFDWKGPAVIAAEDGEIEDDKTGGAKKLETELSDAPVSASHVTAIVKEDAKPAGRAPGAATAAEDKSALAKESPKGESRSATPTVLYHTPSARANGARAETLRTPSVPTGPHAKQPHSSQSRSERDPVHHPPPTQSVPRPGNRHAARGDEAYGRLDRPNDSHPTPSRDHSPNTRAGRPRSPAASGRQPYREQREIIRQPYDSTLPRGDQTPRREPAQDGLVGHIAHDPAERTSRPLEPQTHPDRLKHISSAVVISDSPTPQHAEYSLRNAPKPPADKQHVNPARLAMINADNSSGMSPRRVKDASIKEREVRRERDGRQDERVSMGPPSFQGRSEFGSNGRDIAEPPREQVSRSDGFTDSTPVGPKREKRASRELGTESTYGRLNAPQDVPSGPRQSNGSSTRGGRSFTVPHAASNARTPDTPPQPLNSRQPEQYAGSRGSTKQSSIAQFERPAEIAPPSPGTNDGPHLVHPSRAAQLAQPAPIQTTFTAPNGPRGAASPAAAAPSGPRATARGPTSGTPTGPSPVSGIPPSGPSRRGDKTRNSINASSVASTPSPIGQGVNFRGASARQANASSLSTGAARSNLSHVQNNLDPSHHLRSAHNDDRSPFEEPPLDQSHGRNDLFIGKIPDWQNNGSNGRRRNEERPFRGVEAFPVSGADDGRERRDLRHKHRDSPPRASRRDQDISSRSDTLLAPPLPPQWNRHDAAISGVHDDGRRVGASGRMSSGRNDFRGPLIGSSGPGAISMRREDEMNVRGSPREEGLLQGDSRKRGPPPFEVSSAHHDKRRRGER